MKIRKSDTERKRDETPLKRELKQEAREPATKKSITDTNDTITAKITSIARTLDNQEDSFITSYFRSWIRIQLVGNRTRGIVHGAHELITHRP
jgi:hypothetical protein